MHEKCAAAKKLSSSINNIIIAMQKLLKKFFEHGCFLIFVLKYFCIIINFTENIMN